MVSDELSETKKIILYYFYILISFFL